MRRGNSRGGFERVGSTDLRKAGLPAREARRLRLDRAWRSVAGEAIGRRAHATDIRRGVLEVEIADPAWARELTPLLPRIVARIAREFPDLGIRKFKTTAAGTTLERSLLPDPADQERTLPPTQPTPAQPPRPGDEPALSAGDLLEVATRYLERARAAGRLR